MGSWREVRMQALRDRIRDCPWDKDAAQELDWYERDLVGIQFEDYVTWRDENAIYGDANNGVGVTPAGEPYFSHEGFCHRASDGYLRVIGGFCWKCNGETWENIGEPDQEQLAQQNQGLLSIEDLPGFDPEKPDYGIGEWLRRLRRMSPDSGGSDGQSG